ncbi:hypothetical protein BCR32DRAFT_265630 [Anaeromyces robustus]|uniref:Uncharacterized protein n=1 Tax=Anaeromyces robustus TaxID=1754192 RepID=A0A1Y1XI72_9FUNG|nr:hypothetical protein BCR32DRAFT_265630 [Anaeromyces robustus]|eukprot:ORX85458.1 hypothetical protein BCR32DRAFT_265630 [Anaeromyces robustus]
MTAVINIENDTKIKNDIKYGNEEKHLISREQLHHYMRIIGNLLAKLKQKRFLFVFPLQIGVYLLVIIEAIFSVYIVIHAYKKPYSSMDILSGLIKKDDKEAGIFFRLVMASFYALDHITVITLLAYEIIRNRKHVYIFIFGLNAGLVLLDLYVSCMENNMGAFPRDFFLETASDYLIFHVIIIFLYYLVIITFSYYYKVRTQTLRESIRELFNQIRKEEKTSKWVLDLIDKIEYYF